MSSKPSDAPDSSDQPPSKRLRMTRSDASVGELDEDLHSRQLAVYGRDSMRKMAAAQVVILGMNGLGVEIGALFTHCKFLEAFSKKSLMQRLCVYFQKGAMRKHVLCFSNLWLPRRSPSQPAYLSRTASPITWLLPYMFVEAIICLEAPRLSFGDAECHSDTCCTSCL